MQPAFIQRDGGKQTFGQAVVCFRLACSGKAGRAGRRGIARHLPRPLAERAVPWHFRAGGAEQGEHEGEQKRR